MSNCMGKRPKKMSSGGASKIIAKTPSKENKEKFEKASEQTQKATKFKNSKILGVFPQSSLDKKQAELSRREAVKEMNKIPKEERTMMQLPEGLAKGGMPMVKKGGTMVPAFAADGVGKMSYGGKVKKMSDGKMVTKKKKTTKVAKRKGDGICSRGKTRGRMV